jgi:hypothetical protein
MMVILINGLNLKLLDIKDSLVLRELKARPELKGFKDYRALVMNNSKEHRDYRACREPQVLLEYKVFLEMMG